MIFNCVKIENSGTCNALHSCYKNEGKNVREKTSRENSQSDIITIRKKSLIGNLHSFYYKFIFSLKMYYALKLFEKYLYIVAIFSKIHIPKLYAVIESMLFLHQCFFCDDHGILNCVYALEQP